METRERRQMCLPRQYLWGQNEQDCDIYVSQTLWLSCDQGIQEVDYRKDISLKLQQRENQKLGEILRTI